MRHIVVIARRELDATLRTTSGWLVMSGFLLLAGVLWLGMLDRYQLQMADQLVNPYAAWHLNLTDQLLAPWFGNLTVVLLVVCPALSMRLFAEEQRGHTLELLLTRPIGAGAVVLGKFLGVWAFLVLLLATTAWLPASLWLWGRPDAGAVAGGYLCLLLFGSTVLAIGLLASSLTDSQVVAVLLAFAAAMCLWVLGWVDPDPTSLASQLSLSSHGRDLLQGDVRASDVAYYVLVGGWCLFATWQRLQAYRYT